MATAADDPPPGLNRIHSGMFIIACLGVDAECCAVVYMPSLKGKLQKYHSNVISVTTGEGTCMFTFSEHVFKPLAIHVRWPFADIQCDVCNIQFDLKFNVIHNVVALDPARAAATTDGDTAIRIDSDGRAFRYKGNPSVVIGMQAEKWLDVAYARTSDGDCRLIAVTRETTLMMSVLDPSKQNALEHSAECIAASASHFALLLDGTITLYDTCTFEKTHTFDASFATKIAFVAGNRLAVAMSTTPVRFYDLALCDWTPGKNLVYVRLPSEHIRCLAVSYDGQWIAVSTGRDWIHVFSVADACVPIRTISVM